MCCRLQWSMSDWLGLSCVTEEGAAEWHHQSLQEGYGDSRPLSLGYLLIHYWTVFYNTSHFMAWVCGWPLYYSVLCSPNLLEPAPIVLEGSLITFEIKVAEGFVCICREWITLLLPAQAGSEAAAGASFHCDHDLQGHEREGCIYQRYAVEKRWGSVCKQAFTQLIAPRSFLLLCVSVL